MIHRTFWTALAVVSLLVGCGSSPEPAPQPAPLSPKPADPNAPVVVSSSYRLRATDILRIEVYQEPDLRQDVSISQDGDVTLILVGKVRLIGLTLNEAQQLIAQRYRAVLREPDVTLLVMKYAERKVYFEGMVGRAGPVFFPAEEKLTLLRAISMAGGIPPRGARNDVKLKRVENGKEVTITINVDEISSGKSPDVELQENDYIYVRDSII